MNRHGRPGPRRLVGRRAVMAGVIGLLGLSTTVGLAATGHAAEADLVPETPCARTVEACVDLDSQHAWLIKDGVVAYGAVPISSGAEEEPTPTGTFQVVWKHADHVSGESGGAMPYSVFFAPGGIAFHEGTLDKQSAGCVRLEREDAKVFFDTLNVGDDVEVH